MLTYKKVKSDCKSQHARAKDTYMQISSSSLFSFGIYRNESCAYKILVSFFLENSYTDKRVIEINAEEDVFGYKSAGICFIDLTFFLKKKKKNTAVRLELKQSTEESSFKHLKPWMAKLYI